MSDKNSHPSRLVLDEYLAGVLQDSKVEKHIESCELCRSRVQRMQANDSEFLKEHPSVESLPLKTPDRTRRRLILVPLSALTVAAAVLMLFLSLRQDKTPPQDLVSFDDELVAMAAAEAEILSGPLPSEKEGLLVFGVDSHRNVYWHRPDWVDTASTVYPFPVISMTDEK